MKMSDFAAENKDLTLEVFTTRYTHPFLLVTEEQGAAAARSFETIVLGRLDLESQDLPEALVLPINREGANATAMITLGRARNMNIVLDTPAISKMHAYFQRQILSDEWTVADAGSTNGTIFKGVPLAKNEPMVVQDGDRIELAGVFAATFLMPASMHRELRAAVEEEGL